ncbi:MAG TPA: GNAT family N-acetyltransferase [Thermoanaerobaculia bacterium]|nr:GNAT family N-acetyltransferase [Thermoanaerobaculia bacterium]
MPRRRPTPDLRPATADDVPALAALERSAMPDPWSAGMVAGELEQEDALVLVARDGEDGGGEGSERSPIAYASYRGAAGEAELLRLAVDPARRREGLATALLVAGDRALAERGCVACFLEVRADNTTAIAFYERSGFHRIGRRRGYYAPRPADQRDAATGDGRVDALVYARAIVTASE